MELEELEIDTRPSPVVVALGFLHLGTRDLEDRHPAAVRTAEQDVHELAAPREREATEKEIVGLKHPHLLSRWRPHPRSLPSEEETSTRLSAID